MEQLAPSPVVISDTFPAEVVAGGELYRTARAVITTDRVFVWVADGADRRLVVDEPYTRELSAVAPFHAPRNASSHLTLAGADAPGVHIKAERGCGCGNPLKGWQPWQPFVIGPGA